MKKIFSLLLLLCISNILFAQMPYELTTRQDEYSSLTDPTLVNTSVWGQNSVFTIPLGFSFRTIYEDIEVLNILAGSGGVGAYLDIYYNLSIFHWPFGGGWLLDRGYGTNESQSKLEYEIIDSNDGKIFKIQWTNAGFTYDIIDIGYNTITNSDWIDCQIWLFEEDDRIEVHFGPHEINNPSSLCDFENNGNITGPFTAFYIGDNMIDIYDEANDPLTQWVATYGPVYPWLLVGVPDNGYVWEFTPDFTVNIEEDFKDSDYIWDSEENKLIFSSTSNEYTFCKVYSISGQLLFSQAIVKGDREVYLPLNINGYYLITLISSDRQKSIKILK